MKPLYNDLAFKNIFRRSLVFEQFINSFLEYNNLKARYKVIYAYPEACIMPNHENIKLYFGDIVGILDNENIVSLEIYSTPFNKKMYNKSYGYKSRLFADQLEKNNNHYENMKKVISINLIIGNYRGINNDLVNKYTFKHQKSNKIIQENTIMYLIRLDQIKKIRYVKGEKKFLTFLRIINSETIEEMEKYAKGDKNMEQVIEYMKEWNAKSNENGFERYLKEKEEEAKEKGLKIGRKEGKKEGKEEGIKEGKEVGIKEGKEAGKKEQKYEIIRKMQQENVGLDLIKRITGLTEKEITKIINSKN